MLREFPGAPVVRTLPFHCWGLGLIPGRGTKILQDVWDGQTKQQQQQQRMLITSDLG